VVHVGFSHPTNNFRGPLHGLQDLQILSLTSSAAFGSSPSSLVFLLTDPEFLSLCHCSHNSWYQGAFPTSANPVPWVSQEDQAHLLILAVICNILSSLKS
jgi:hypothetical protein